MVLKRWAVEKEEEEEEESDKQQFQNLTPHPPLQTSMFQKNTKASHFLQPRSLIQDTYSTASERPSRSVNPTPFLLPCETAQGQQLGKADRWLGRFHTSLRGPPLRVPVFVKAGKRR